MIELDKIYNEDCLEGMKKIPDHSVDCIICDLPYGTTSCFWDVIIPFDKLWEQYNRIIKNNKPIILFCQQPFTTLLIASNINSFREEIIWEKNKSGSGLNAKNKHLKYHENIIVFCQESSYTYNPIRWQIDTKKIVTRNKYEYLEKNNIIGTHQTRTKSKDDGFRFPKSILKYDVPYSPKKNSKTLNGDYRIHPTQKPVALIEYLIKTYSNEGDVVLDNCMGSGTTAVACLNTNRHFIGFELNEDYWKKSIERIETIKQQTKLF